MNVVIDNHFSQGFPAYTHLEAAFIDDLERGFTQETPTFPSSRPKRKLSGGIYCDMLKSELFTSWVLFARFLHSAYAPVGMIV